MSWQTLTEVLAHQADQYPDLLYVRCLQRGEITNSYTYAQIWQLAARWKMLFQARGVEAGDAVILALPNTGGFVGAYYGALLAGGVPAPAAPFRRIAAGDVYLETIAGRVRAVSARALVVTPEQMRLAETPPFDQLAGLAVLSRDDLPGEAPEPVPGSDPEALGLLQFTSGTSGQAKAVELTHRALLAQIEQISTVLRLVDRDEDWAVSWLPLYHDMGLIGFLLTPAIHAGHVTLMPTEDFIMRPSLWIKALSEFGASITGAPPSAYALCARRMKASEVGQYDLSRVRIALAGAETVTSDSLQRFVETFAPVGFRETALMPTYGMAENSLAVTMPLLDRGPRFDHIDPVALQAGRAESVDDGRAVAALGSPLPGTAVKIVSEDGQPLGERQVGEVIVSSPSLMRGYAGQPDATRQTLRDGWLYTGDLGYLAGGELYLTGRKKEVLIVGGSNYYPDDLEQVAGAVSGVRMGRVVAISYHTSERATEAVAVLAETGLKDAGARDDLRLRIRQALVNAAYPVSDVVLLPPKTIEYTQNGKLRRLACKQRYLAGEFV